MILFILLIISKTFIYFIKGKLLDLALRLSLQTQDHVAPSEDSEDQEDLIEADENVNNRNPINSTCETLAL